MADRISWIKNLLSHGTTAEKQMVREVAKHARDTGTEMMAVGEQGQPKILFDFLRSYGGPTEVSTPGGYDQFMLEAGKQGIPVSTAHPHPTNIALPSMGDYHVWANANKFYDNASNNLGTGTYLPDLARQNMWIAGPRSPNDVTHIPAMPNRGGTADYELLRKIKELSAKNDMNLSRTGSHGYDVSRKFDDYTGSWGLFPDERAELYGSIADVPLYNRLAGLNPIHMDPQTQLVRGRPDILAGDVFPEWMKLLDKSNLDPTKAEGGQVEDTPFPLAYASQYFDDGGQMKGPVLATTGPEIMRKGLEPAMRAVMEYFGGVKRPTIPRSGPQVNPNIPHWATRFQDTTWKPVDKPTSAFDDQWLHGMQQAGIDVSPQLPRDHPIRDALVHYTGSEYDSMSSALREFADNSDKVRGPIHKPGLQWWRGNDPDFYNNNVLELAKYLQDQELELPYDIYRGNRLRAEDFSQLHPEHGLPQLRGTGIGSFSYLPEESHNFGQDIFSPKKTDHFNAESYPDENVTKVPSIVRIPQGSKVRGMNVAQYSGLPSESEVLLAPFQGFDVTDTNLISGNPAVHRASPRLLLNAEPSGIYDPNAPKFYAEGGQVEDTMPSFPLAYGSQYFAEGGAVPGYQLGGLEKGLAPAMRSAIEYFGGIKRNPLGRTLQEAHEPPEPRWYDRYKDTSAPKMRWDELEKEIPHIAPPPSEIQQAMRWYSGEGYSPMNSDMRFHLDKKDLSEYLRKQDTNAALLTRWLQDQQYELPFDIYRGSRMRAKDFGDLSHEHGPQVHGEGFGSFSFKPTEGAVWGSEMLQAPNDGRDVKVPGLYRIPQGTKVQGYPMGSWGEMPNEQEVLMAPFQGFDVHDANLIKAYRPEETGHVPRMQLDISPSGIFDPRTPRIFAKGGAVPGFQTGGLNNFFNYIRGLSKPIRAEHVSPHDFDRFSSAHIGRGEGNQDFGHGLYFSQSPGVRDFYIRNLRAQFDKEPLTYDVNLHGDPKSFLSMDEPLGQQGIIGKRASDYLSAPGETILRPPTTKFPDRYEVTDPAFAKFMSDEGAAGTRYFDSRSKQQGFGTENYVTFPTMDDIIEITGKKAEGGQVDDFPLAYASQYFDEGGQNNDDPSLRYSIPYGQFAPSPPPTPTFQVPIGKGQATLGGNYDMINKMLDAQLGYEHPVGKHGARLGAQGYYNKYIGEGGDQVKPNWGVGLRLNVPFAEGGPYDPYDDIAEAQRLMGAYK